MKLYYAIEKSFEFLGKGFDYFKEIFKQRLLKCKLFINKT